MSVLTAIVELLDRCPDHPRHLVDRKLVASLSLVAMVMVLLRNYYCSVRIEGAKKDAKIKNIILVFVLRREKEKREPA